MGTVLVNYSGKTRKATINGREYIVARATLIVPGVLNGSKGALYYPPEEIAKNFDAWNGIPLTNGHPAVSGNNVSARSPSIIQSHGLGHVYNVNITKTGRLRGEAWFDVKSCERVRPEILNKLKSGEPIELSTGLFTNNVPANNGAHHNGRQYTHVARDYRPDHLAILLDQQGACSLRDGCGVLTDNCGGVGGKPGPCPSGILADHLTAEKIHDPQEFRAAYSSLDDAEKKAVVKNLANRGLIHPVDAKKRGTMTASEIIKSAGAQYQKAKLDHEMVPTNRHIPFRDSEVFKRMAGTTHNLACVLNESNVCVNCGGPGSGKPGPCPSGVTKRDTVLDTPIGADREQALRAHKLGTEATDSTANLMIFGTMGQKPSPASQSAISSVMDLTRRVNKRAILSSPNGIGQTAKAVVQAQKAHEKASRTLLDAAQSDSGAAYELRKAAAKHDLAAKSFGELASRMKPTGNAMHTLNAAGICVNCGGKGGKPGPCPTGDSGKKKTGKKRGKAQPPQVGERMQFDGKASDGIIEGSFPVYVVDAHSNKDKVTHTKDGEDYEGASKHIATALVRRPASVFMGKIRESKEFHAPHYALKSIDESTTNSHSGDDMATKKEKMVQFLTTNCDCWKGEKDAEVLSNFDEDKLKTLIAATKRATENGAAIEEIRATFGAEAEGLTANAMPAFVKGKALAKAPPEEMESAEEEPAESEMEEVVAPPAKKGKKKMPVVANQNIDRAPEQPPTLNEWLASAPVEVQEVIRTAQAVERGAKETLVKSLVGNSSAKTKGDREELAKFLMAKPLAELNTLSKLSVNRAKPSRDPMDFLTVKPAPAVNYAGLGEDFDDDEPTGNEDTLLDAPLGVPTANVDWAAEAKLIPTGKRK